MCPERTMDLANSRFGGTGMHDSPRVSLKKPTILIVDDLRSYSVALGQAVGLPPGFFRWWTSLTP